MTPGDGKRAACYGDAVSIAPNEAGSVAAEAAAIRAAFDRAIAAALALPDAEQAFRDASALGDLAKQLEIETAGLRSHLAARMASARALSITELGEVLGVSRSRAAQLVAAGRSKENPVTGPEPAPEDEELKEIRAVSDPLERARRATAFIDGQTVRITAVSAIRQEAIELLRDTMTQAEIAKGAGLTRARVSQLLGSAAAAGQKRGDPVTRKAPRGFGADFSALFRRSAFRLELLDRYVAANEEEPYRRFLAGEPQDPAWREPWAQIVGSATAGGRRMSRVHVVSEPLSDYLKFEFTCGYPASVAAGEDIRILREEDFPRSKLPDADYWLFDDEQAALMSYDQEGNWLGADMTSNPKVVARCRVGRDLAMEHSVPLANYRLPD